MALDTKLGRLTRALTDAGIPIVGVRFDQAGTGFAVDYDASATVLQRTQGAAVVAAFDKRERRARPVSTFVSEFISNTTAADKNRALGVLLWQLANENPQLYARLKAAAATLPDADEPDPNGVR